MEREIRLTNQIVLDVAARHDEVGEEEEIKGQEYPFYVSTITWKEKQKSKDHPVSEGDKYRPKLLRDLVKEGKYATEADQEGEEQK